MSPAEPQPKPGSHSPLALGRRRNGPVAQQGDPVRAPTGVVFGTALFIHMRQLSTECVVHGAA